MAAAAGRDSVSKTSGLRAIHPAWWQSREGVAGSGSMVSSIGESFWGNAEA